MTPEQVKALSNEELDKVMAEAQGWRNPNELLVIYDQVLADEHVNAWVDEGDNFVIRVDDYHPTSNTTEGKAQCFDLMGKFKGKCLGEIDLEENYIAYKDYTQKRVAPPLDYDYAYLVFDSENFQRKICEAIALSQR